MDIVNPDPAPHLKKQRSKPSTKFKCVVCNMYYINFAALLDCNMWHRGTL